MSYDALLPSAKVTLTYPVYACDFDSKDATRLIVGGGGGAGRSGVGNKITVLKSAAPLQLDEVAEIDLSKDEDSIMSLAVGKTIGDSTPVYAGINSSPKDVTKGTNEHFRTFSIEDTKKGGKTTATKIVQKSKHALFTKTETDIYQRVTRVSRPFASSQLGVVATGMAKSPEIVLFDTAYSVSGKPHIKGKFETPTEAEDTDVLQSGEDEYLFAYCTKKDIYLKKISGEDNGASIESIWHMPGPDSQMAPPVMDFRSIRFLTPNFVLLLVNIAGRKGVILQIIRLPSKSNPRARIALQARLHKKVVQATGLAATCLAPTKLPQETLDSTQFVVAVAGHDTSISILTFDHVFAQGMTAVAEFHVRTRIPDVHPLQMTAIALSNIRITQDQHVLKLASTSMANTVVTHTIPLKTRKSGGNSVYEVDINKPSKSPIFYLLTTLLVLFLSFATQTVLEIRGSSPELVGAKQFLTPFAQGLLKPVPGVPTLWEDIQGYWQPAKASVANAIPTTNPVSTVTDSLNDMLKDLVSARSEGKEDQVIFIREEQGGTDGSIPASIKADLHDEEIDGPHGGKSWDDLSQEEKKWWIKKLNAVGHSTEDYGVTVLKGVVFGTIGQAIGAMAA